MKYIFYISLIIIGFYSSRKADDKNTNNILSKRQISIENKEKISENKSTQTITSKINIDEALKDKYNTYLAFLENANLSLCSYDLFDITEKINFSAFKKTTETYTTFGDKEIVNVYRNDSSFVKTHYNSSVSPNSLNIVCGHILSNELLKPSKVKIGMKKNDFWTLFFQQSEIINQIRSITIYQDETGEAFTTYKFKNDRLIEIEFDSDYDWINKE